MQISIFAMTSIPPTINNVQVAFDCEQSYRTSLANLVDSSSFPSVSFPWVFFSVLKFCKTNKHLLL